MAVSQALKISAKAEKVLLELRSLRNLVDKEIQHFEGGGHNAALFDLEAALKCVSDAQDDLNELEIEGY